jgi:hypothetical protein
MKQKLHTDAGAHIGACFTTPMSSQRWIDIGTYESSSNCHGACSIEIQKTCDYRDDTRVICIGICIICGHTGYLNRRCEMSNKFLRPLIAFLVKDKYAVDLMGNCRKNCRFKFIQSVVYDANNNLIHTDKIICTAMCTLCGGGPRVYR